MEVVRRILMVALLLWLGRAHCAPTESRKMFCTPSKPKVSFKAEAFTGAHPGEMMVLQSEGDGVVDVEARYGLRGIMSGKFCLSPSALDSLRELAGKTGFFDLPEEISAEAVPLHETKLRLTLSFKGRVRTVELYWPEGIKDGKEARDFLLVWRKVLGLIPAHPPEWARK